MVLGGVIQAIIFGNVAILVQNMGEAEKMLQAKLDALQEFLKFHDVPDHVTQKAMDALEYTWNYSQGVNDRDILADFPKALRTDLTVASRPEIPLIFKDLGEGFQRAVVSQFHLRVFVPEDYIIHAGDTGSEMYVIRDGECVVMSEDETATLALLKSGDFFGDIDMVLRTRRMATVKTATYCTLFVLHRDGLEEVLKQFPDHRDMIVQNTKKRRDTLWLKNTSMRKTPLTRMPASSTDPEFSISPFLGTGQEQHPQEHEDLVPQVEDGSPSRDCPAGLENMALQGASSDYISREGSGSGFGYPFFSPAEFEEYADVQLY